MSVREHLQRLSSDSLVYGVGAVLGRAVNLLLVPVLARVLLKQQFGVADLVLSYTQSVLLVLVFGMDGALARFFYDQPDRDARIRMASSSFVFRLITGGTVALLLALTAEPLAERLLGGAVYAKYLRLGALTLPFTLFCLFANDVLRVTFQPWKFVSLNITQTVAVGGVTLYLVLHEHLGVAGVLYGKLLGDAATALLGLLLCRHSLQLRFSRTLLTRMLRYGLPLVPVSFAYGIIGSVDRYFLQRTGSLDQVGAYAVAMKFFTVVTMGISAFQLAFGPFAFARARDPDAPRLFARVFALYITIASLGALLAGLAAPAVVELLAGRSYADAARPAMWLAFAAVAQGAYYVAALGITLSLRTPLLSWTAVGAALVAIIANGVITPRYGAEGAAFATFLAYTASAVMAYVISQRVWPMPYRGAKFAALFVGAVVLGAIVVRVAPAGGAGLALRLAAAAVFAVVAWRFEVWKDRGAVRHGPTASPK